MNSSSCSPFSVPASARSSRPSTLSRRVFTRSPFGLFPTIPQVADHHASVVERPLAVDDETRSTPAVWSVPPFRPSQAAVYRPHRLHPRDRSTYAWFESVGLLLSLASVAGACVALVLMR